MGGLMMRGGSISARWEPVAELAQKRSAAIEARPEVRNCDRYRTVDEARRAWLDDSLATSDFGSWLYEEARDE